MTDSGFLKLKSGMLKLLRTDLDPRLTYHNPEHTEDVLRARRTYCGSRKYYRQKIIASHAYRCPFP